MLSYLQWLLLEFGFNKAADSVYRFRVRREARRVEGQFALEFPNPDVGHCSQCGGDFSKGSFHSCQLTSVGR